MCIYFTIYSIIIATVTLQVPALLLVSTGAVYLEVVRENLQTATVTICAIPLKTAALMQTHCVRKMEYQV